VTLTDFTDQAAPGDPSSRIRPTTIRRRRWRRAGPAWLAIAASLVAVGLIGWRIGLVDASGSPATVARPPATSPSDPGAAFSSAALVGLPASKVLADLQRLGIRPNLADVATSAEAPGTVLSVEPGGILAPGTVVTVTVAVPLPADNHNDGGGPETGGSDGGGDGGH
jgi:serine/threonine-protein kinase